MTKAKIAAALVLALGTAAGLGLSHYDAEEANAPAAHRDLHGDALPRGAIVRLGTVRLQHDGEVTSGFFSADGKTLTTAGLDHTVRRWDVATGKELQRSAIQLPKEEHYTHRGHRVSPDGKTLATIHTQNTDGGPVTSICLWNLATGKPRLLEGRPNNNRWFSSVTFSPDGAILAAASVDGDVRLWDVAGGALIRLISTGDGSVALAFSPRGDLLALGTAKGTSVREVATGKEIHQFQKAASKAFSPDGKKLASAGSPVRVWNMETGKIILEVNLDERVTHGANTTTHRPHDVEFSPDGKLLAVNISSTVVLLDAVTGNKVRTVLGDRRASGKRMFFSPDGRLLALPGQVNFYLYETATGKPLDDVGHLGVVKSVAFAPDGKTLATADPGAVRLWDGATGKELRRWPSHLIRERSALSFAPDGKSLAHAGGAAIKLWNPATGDELTQFKALQGSGVAFSPDGALLATTTGNGSALWDMATGRNVRSFDSENLRTDLAYSPDGKTLAGGGSALYLWDAATGKRRHKIEPPSTSERPAPASYTALAFSPDGAHLAAFGGRTADTPALDLYDVGTGKQVGRFQTTECHKCHMVLAYSPDGKTLASGDTSRDITLWEVITGKPRAKLTGHRRWIEGLAFASDGKRLASASADGTALVWDLREAAKPAPAEPDACWRVLSGDDSAAAYDALHSLVRTPEQALPVLRQHLKPVATVEPRRLEAQVADLESDNFATRQRATEELEKLGDQAEAALRKVLAGKPPLETQQRIDKLLDRLATVQVSSPALLQALRGVEVLEHMDTAEAREHLRVLAGGASEARLTREAKAALDRLVGRNR